MSWTPKEIAKWLVWTVYMLALMAWIAALVTGNYVPNAPAWVIGILMAVMFLAGVVVISDGRSG